MGAALVLGAGGPVGFAFHAGVLAALQGWGWDARDADLVVGTSIGAVTAGLLRAGMAPADMLAQVTHGRLSAAGDDLVARAGGWPAFASPAEGAAPRWGRPASPSLLAALARDPRRLRPGLVLAGLANAGTVDPTAVADAFDRLLDATWPSAPMWVTAVDLDGGHRVTFGRPGAPPVTPGVAIAASCAVPSYFAPVVIGGHRHIDGGVHSPANTDLVGDLTGAERPDVVIVSMPMGVHGPAGRRGVDLPGRRLNHAASAARLRPLVDAGVPVLTLAPTSRELEVMGYDAFDSSQLTAVASAAHATAAARLAAASLGGGAGAAAGRTARALLALRPPPGGRRQA